MIQLRNVFPRFFLATRLVSSTTGPHSFRNAAVISATSRIQKILSRSRPPLGEDVCPISRLPAAVNHGPSATRYFSSEKNLDDAEIKRKVEDISGKFKEAMDLLDDARGSMGTVYFSEDMTDAENAIEEVLSDYDTLMKEINEDQRRNVVRTIGLKIEELKAQVQMLKDSLKE